jgi:hypothetical protein
MKHINRIQLGIANLQYHSPADCIELRLYLLSLIREFVRQYQQAKDKQKAKQIFRVFMELENLYKSFTSITFEKVRNYKAQFEFVKALICDQIERTAPALQLSNIAVA